MTTYAVAREVPDDCSYLTAGKRYEVFNDDDVSFESVGDDGDIFSCVWKDCSHLNGGDWCRVETDDDGIAVWTPPEEGVPPPDWRERGQCSGLPDMGLTISRPSWNKGVEYFYRPPAEEGDYNIHISAIQLQPPPPPDFATMSDEELAALECAVEAERERRADPDRIYREALKAILDAWQDSLCDDNAIAVLKAFDQRER